METLAEDRTALKGFLFVLFYLAWLGFFFWAFSFQYSSGYFQYHFKARVAEVVIGMAVVAVCPLSFVWCRWRVRRRRLGSLSALAIHCVICGAAFLLGVEIAGALAKSHGPYHLEADDAMGLGFDLLLILCVFVLSVVVLGLCLFYERNRRASQASTSSGW